MVGPSKTPLLLLRGLMRECRHWGDFPHRLQRSMPDRRVITLDIAGNGEHYQRRSANSIAGMTNDLRAQLADKGGLPPQLQVLALSMGGMIALEWMTRFPEEIAGAVLINTSVRAHSPFYHRLYWRSYLMILQLCLSSPEQREKYILYLTSNKHQDNQTLLNHWRRWRQQRPVASGNAKRQLYAAMTFSVSSQPVQPLLFIKSRQDRLVYPGCSEKTARAWQATCLENADAGHDLPLDDPDWLVAEMAAWLADK